MSATKRDVLVRTAYELFYEHGFHATGIDKILATAGVSKPTLYRYFNSKEELIIAALKYRDREVMHWMKAEAERRASTPRERILAVFDAFHDWYQEEGFNGCMFINVVAEYPALGDQIHQAAVDHKTKAGHYIRELVVAAGISDPTEVTAQLMLLIEGAIVTAHASGDSSAGSRARGLADSILHQALD